MKIYEYDENGNLIKEIDKEGYVTTYEYDPLNLVKEINYNGEKQIEYKYNPLGQLIEMKDWLGTTSMELDPLGRVLKVTDFENKITEYTWTPMGEKESITYIDGTKVNYQYDKLGRMTQVEDAYGDITTYKYSKIGNLVERILPNGSRTEYQYDAISQITELTEHSPTGKITDTFRYEYDNAGNRIKTHKNRYELDDEAEDWEEREEINYRYDALNQLIEITTSNNQIRKYYYDTLGNRIRKEEWNSTQIQEAINYEYDILNRLINTYEDIEEGKTYRYDDRGSLTQVRSGGKIFNKYEYDETNSLVKVTDKHGAITEYTYDGFGNRIKSIIDLNHPGGGNRPDKGNNGNNGNAYGHENGNNGNAYGHDKDKGNPKPGWDHQNKRNNMEQNFVVDITSPYNNVLMIYGDHYQTQRYTYGIDRINMDMWMLEDEDNGWVPDKRGTHLSETPDRLYYLHDELGSTTKVIGENGKTSAHYNYDESGRPLSFRKFDQNWPGPDNTFGYTGYQYDVSSELYYAQARYYLPEIGRFISEDPWQGTIAEPTTMNPYPYVQNNPIKYVDPLGLRHMVQDGGSAGVALPSTSTKDPINKAREEVKKDEINNKNGFCNTVKDVEYLILYDPVYEEEIEDGLRQEYKSSNLFGKGIVLIKAAGHGWAKRYRYSKAIYQKNSYEQLGVDPEISGTSLDITVSYVAGEAIIGSLSKGYNSIKGTRKSIDISDDALKWLNKGDADKAVYYGIKNGKEVYTGITKQELAKRLYQHNYGGKNLDDLVKQVSGLTRNQARAVEQYLIENGTANALNKINSISPYHRYYDEAMRWAEEFISTLD